MYVTRLRLGLIGTLLLAGAAVVVVSQYQTQLKLKQENEVLRQQLEQSAQLAADNERLSGMLAQAQSPPSDSNGRVNELLKLRGEVGLLRQQVKEVDTLREQNRQARAQLTAGASSPGSAGSEPPSATYWPKESWRFQGYATPEAALQSQFYAASQGDVTNFLASVTGNMKATVEKDLADKSDAEVAAKFHKEMDGLQSVRILGQTYPSENEVALTVAFAGPDKQSESTLTLNRIGGEWKLADVTHK